MPTYIGDGGQLDTREDPSLLNAVHTTSSVVPEDSHTSRPSHSMENDCARCPVTRYSRSATSRSRRTANSSGIGESGS
jgi:hypothetical protein